MDLRSPGKNFKQNYFNPRYDSLMNDIAKLMIGIGISLLAIGVILLFLNKIPGFGRLPGDILVKKENFTFYFPITTSILISVILSLIVYLFNRK